MGRVISRWERFSEMEQRPQVDINRTDVLDEIAGTVVHRDTANRTSVIRVRCRMVGHSGLTVDGRSTAPKK